MSIQLEKRVKSVGIVLAKRGLTKIPPVRVGVAYDVSGSAQWMYDQGIIQETSDRLQAVALKFDDNGELDAWAFDNYVTQLESATADDEGSFITEQIVNNRSFSKWGGTSYAPVWQAVTSFYFTPTAVAAIVERSKGLFGGLKSLFGGGSPAASAPSAAVPAGQLPAMLLFVTDGECGDESASRRVMAEATQNPKMYFQMVGVGHAKHFGFLQELANKYPNVGFINLSSLAITDEQLYDQLITQEVVDWVKTASV